MIAIGSAAVSAPKHGARGLDVLIGQTGTERDPGHPAHVGIRVGHESIQRHGEVPEHLPACAVRINVARWSPPVIYVRFAIGRLTCPRVPVTSAATVGGQQPCLVMARTPDPAGGGVPVDELDDDAVGIAHLESPLPIPPRSTAW